MKVLVKFNKNISTPKQVRTFKVFDLGVVTSTLNDLLNDSIIEIDDLTLPILKIKKDNVYNYYLINDLGKTNNFVNPYYTDDFTKDINLEDLISINTSFNDVITKHSELILDDGTNPHGTTKNDVGLGNVPNLNTTNAVNNSHIHSNKSILDLINEPLTTSLKSLYDGAVTSINNLLLTGQRLITSSEITKLSNTSGINTGDETTESIQIKRPLKTINNQSLEGTGNIDIETANNFPYTEITKTELDTLIANSELTKGFYKISGVNTTLYGGTTILLEVLEDNKLPIDAYGLFYNPKYDKTIDGYGVAKDYAIWKDESEQLESGVYTIGQNVIWGGKHWICIAETNINTKYIVDKFNLSTDYFEEVPFNDTHYNLVLDKIKYDYEYDLIIERNEKNSNVVSFSYENLEAFDNPIKNFQWGNVFNAYLGKGIGNNKVYDSINENINFTGGYQFGLYFSSNNNQSKLIFKNNASQYNLNFTNQSAQYSLVLNDGVSQNNLVFNKYQRSGITISESETNLTFDGNKQATKLTGNQFFTGKTTNDFAQIGDIPETLELGETASTAYRGDRGKIAYDHSQATGNPHSTKVEELNDVGSEITTIVDTDVILKKESGGLWRKITWANIKANLKTYFDSIYTTSSAVASQITTALVGYATQSFVNTGLATKQDKFFSHKLTTPTAYVTGTVSETEVYRLPLPPGTFNTVDVLKIPLMLVKKLGTNGTIQVRGKMSTSETMPTGTTDLIFTTPVATAGNQTLGIIKTFFIDNGNIKGIQFTGPAYTDNGAGAGVISEKPFDIAVTNYLYLSVINGSASDQTRLEAFQLTNS